MSHVDMTGVYKRAFLGLIQYVTVPAAIAFITAGTFNYRQAWVAIAIWFVAGLSMTLYLMKYDPALLVRRTQIGVGAEKATKQKIIVTAMILSYFIGALVPGLDHRF